MDLHLKQWRIGQEDESENQTSAKIPKLIGITDQQQSQAAALPLFAPEPTSKLANLSAFPPDAGYRFPKMGGYFSSAQWQELELQALIYRHMLAGAAVPPELLQQIKKSLSHSYPYYLHHHLHHYPHYQHAWYWGRAAMDPEPGRCRRTDGKKWRCSRDVVAGHKYCERHMHRGRNRSRKPVEIPTPNSAASTGSIGISGSGGGGGGTLKPSAYLISGQSGALGAAANATNFVFSGSSPSSDLLHLNQSSSDAKTENKNLFETERVPGNKSDRHILRHFFDDWPRSMQEPESSGNNVSPMSSVTCLSISMPENPPSDVSLKLSTGNTNGEEAAARHGNNRGRVGGQEQQLNWTSGWAANQMGGPLAEALRSAGSSASPTSVLHQLQRGHHVST